MKHILAVFVAVLAVSAAHAQQVKPSCTDQTRDCMIKAATAYLDALTTHDASKVPFAPDVKRTQGGHITGQGETALREKTKDEPDMAGHANTRFFVDEKTHNVIAYTLLRVPGTKADPIRKTYADTLPPGPSTTHLAERFKVEKGLITEIEAIYTVKTGTMDSESNWPDAMASAQTGAPCEGDVRSCMTKAAKSYLDAIVTHDAAKVPFAPDAKRTEQGRITAQGDGALRDSTKLQPDMVGHANTRFFVDEATHNVVAYTLLRIPGTKADPNRKTYADKLTPQPSTVHLAERFKVEKGMVTEIEALFTIENGTMDGTSNWPD